MFTHSRPKVTFSLARKGSDKAAEIVVDFSFLLDQGRIHPIEPSFDEMGRQIGKRHYKVEYEMIIQVVDRDLTCKYFRLLMCRLSDPRRLEV